MWFLFFTATSVYWENCPPQSTPLNVAKTTLQIADKDPKFFGITPLFFWLILHIYKNPPSCCYIIIISPQSFKQILFVFFQDISHCHPAHTSLPFSLVKKSQDALLIFWVLNSPHRKNILCLKTIFFVVPNGILNSPLHKTITWWNVRHHRLQ